MSNNILLLLRKLTVSVKLLPGSVLVLDFIRRFCFNKPVSVRINDLDGDLAINLRPNEHMQIQVFRFGSCNSDILLIPKKLLKPGMAVIDAGANIGEITLVAAKAVGASGHVYAFEPISEISDALLENVRLNNFNQISIHKYGLSDETEDKAIYRATSDFKDGSKNDGLATLYQLEKRATKVCEIHLLTLDNFCEHISIDRFHLIKMDIEGAELPALKGGLKILKRFKPYIIVEVQQETSCQAGYNASDALSFLKRLGYRFEVIGRKGSLKTVDEDSLGRFQNILCSPLRVA